MQFPITIGLRRSFLLSTGLLAAHGLALVVICLPPWPAEVVWGAEVAVLVSALLAWRLSGPSITGLRLFADGRLACLVGEGGRSRYEDAELLPGATAHPCLSLFRVRVRGKRIFAVILPDSAPPDDCRRLRVWLRWRAGFRTSPDVA